MRPGGFFNALSESTLMPVSLVVLLGGIVFWASSIAARTDVNSTRLDKIEAKQQQVVDLQEKLSSIETKVDMIYDRIKAHEMAGMIRVPQRPLPRN
jgi:uncharacterized protein